MRAMALPEHGKGIVSDSSLPLAGGEIRGSPFRSHMILAVGIVLLLLGITGGMTISLFQSAIDQNFSRAAMLAQQRLKGEIRHVNGITEALAHSAPVLEALLPAGRSNQSGDLFVSATSGLPDELEGLVIYDLQGHVLASSGHVGKLAALRDGMLLEIISTGRPAARMGAPAGVAHYLLGYPVILSPAKPVLGVLIAKVNFVKLAGRAIDTGNPNMIAELRLGSGESLFKVGGLGNGDERVSVSLALGQPEDLLPPIFLELSQPKNDALRPFSRLRFIFLFSLLFAIGIIAYFAYRIARRRAASLPWSETDDKSSSHRLINVEQLLLKDRAFMASSSGIMIVSMSSRPPIVETVNPAYESITGYAPAEIVGQPPGKLAETDRDQPGLRELRCAIAEERSATVTLRNYRKDGSLFWNRLSVSPVHDSHGRLTHYVGILNDITAQKSAEEQVMAWVRRLDMLSAMSVDGLVALDMNSRVSYANDAFLRAFELDLPAVMRLELRDLDQHLAQCCDPRYPYPRIEAHPSTFGVDGAFNCEMEIQLARPQRRVLLRTIRQGSHETSLLLYFQDITKARELEDMKSEFLATAAHELRTPMASILGFSELLLQRDFDAESSRDPLEIIVRQARRVTDLLNELLDLARIEARRGKDFKLAVADLKHIVEAVVLSIPELNGRVLIDAPDQAYLVNVDKPKITQALSNLLDNALKFSPPDESVTISMRLTADEKLPRISVAIEDRGIGMSAEQMVRFGERFWRADPSGVIPGTGLGVSLVKEIIQLHGGSLEVSSEFGKGSCITFYLPLVVHGEAALAALVQGE
jgi:PAS domain S-box-containing protein